MSIQRLKPPQKSGNYKNNYINRAKCFNKGTYTNSMKSVKTIQLTQLTVEGVIVKMFDLGLKDMIRK